MFGGFLRAGDDDGLAVVVTLVLIAIFAPLIAPFDPTQQGYAYIAP